MSVEHQRWTVAAAREALTENGLYLTLVPVADIEMYFPGQTELKPRGGYFVVWSPKGEDLDVLSAWVREGKLRAVIDSRFPLDDIQAAHDRSRSLRARGKIVIPVRD